MTKSFPYQRYDTNYSTADAFTEVLRQTERHLEEQQRLTSSADQRAIAFAAVMIVVTGILIGNPAISEIDKTRFWVAIIWLVSVSLSIFSARPTRIYGSGGTSISLVDYVDGGREGYLVGTLIERNERNITHNDKMLKRSAWIFRGALFLGFAGTVIFLGDWIYLNEQTLDPQGGKP